MSTSPPPAQIARRLAGLPDLWRPLRRFDAANRYYTKLFDAPDHQAWLLTWLPGQATGWHDHGGSAGAFVVLEGTLTEEQALLRPDGQFRVRPQASRLVAGAVRPFGSRHVHRVTNADPLPAVSLHVYSPSLSEMRDYDQQGSLLRLSRSQLAGVNW